MGAAPLFLAPLRLEEVVMKVLAPGIEVTRIGMGPVRATAARTRLERGVAAPRPLVIAGLGGGLERDMAPGLIVVGSEIRLVGRDEAVPLYGADVVAAILSEAGLRVRVAPIVSSPRILAGAAQREAARGRDAAAVDMESYWLTPLAAGRPFAVVRATVDAPGREVRSLATPLAALRVLHALGAAARALRSWSTSTLSSYSLREVGDL